MELWGHINLHRKRQCWLLLLLMVLASISEVFSVGMVIPFLGALTDPDKFFMLPIIQPLLKFFGIYSSSELLLPLTLIFSVALILVGIIRFCLLWSTSRVAFLTGVDLGVEIYRRTLFQPYSVHLSRNSSEVINGVAQKASGSIENAVLPAMNLLSSTFMTAAILIVLVMIDLTASLISFVLFTAIYSLIIMLTRKSISISSAQIAHESSNVIRLIQEGLGSIRDILVDGTQQVYCNLFRQANLNWRLAQSRANIIASSPRYGIEVVGSVLIVSLAYFLTTRSNGVASSIPIIGALVLGAQRLLPNLQQAYSAYVLIQNGKASLQDTVDLLNQKLPEYAGKSHPDPLVFLDRISMEGLSFSYDAKSNLLLNEIDITIKKGARLGIIGATGAGKSTLIDIIMGLLNPTQGYLKIDGIAIGSKNFRAWQANIAHVPQVIFLTDGTILENIAFGIPFDQIDLNKVYAAARKAELADVVEEWPQKYNTVVGERGVRLSGGQRQRIGIARALYKEASVIILDEATSALDTETENAVMKSIESLGNNLTIIIIAHRISTLKQCTDIIRLENGKVQMMGGYDNIIN